MDIFSSISSKTLSFDSYIENSMGVYGDASFSSYLNGKDDGNFIRKPTESTRYLKNPNMIIPGGSGGEDGEIGVFRAEKYFSGGMDEDGGQRSANTRNPLCDGSQKLDKLVVAHHRHNIMDEPLKPKPWLGTPSVGSESSSINSQRPLLKMVRNSTTTTTSINNNNNFSRDQKNNNNNNNNKSFLSNTLGCCMCYSRDDKSAVETNEDVGEISFSNAVTTNPSRTNNKFDQEPSSFRENHFSFPTGGSLKVVHFQDAEEVAERKSLEVFGSPVMGRLRNKPISLEKRLAMLSWDHTNSSNNNNLGGLFYNDDEVNSDCSSDLFEIESLTKQTNPFHSPTASCYAPSEASVEWSVVTASALDFDERRPSTTSPTRVPPPPPPRRVNVNKEVIVVQKRRSSSLLGCKSEKAVKVAEDNINGRKMSAKSNSDHLSMEPRNVELSMPVKRLLEGETKVGGISFRSQGPPPPPPPHRSLATRSLPRPYSPRLSNITFNIQ